MSSLSVNISPPVENFHSILDDLSMVEHSARKLSFLLELRDIVDRITIVSSHKTTVCGLSELTQCSEVSRLLFDHGDE